jgi:hypothetical protein
MITGLMTNVVNDLWRFVKGLPSLQRPQDVLDAKFIPAPGLLATVWIRPANTKECEDFELSYYLDADSMGRVYRLVGMNCADADREYLMYASGA